MLPLVMTVPAAEWARPKAGRGPAEVAMAIREEFARTLTDVVYRRMMIGLRSNQGRDLYEAVSLIAAREFSWDETQRLSELEALNAYSDSLRV